jgi:Flp pilus assembly protein TadD
MSPWVGVLVLLAGLALGIFAFTMRKRSSLLAGSLLLVLVSILPTLEIIPAGEVFAPRYLYLPLLFAAPLSGALLYRIPRACLLALLLVWIPLGWQASQPYTSRAAYWTTRMEYGEETPMGWNALGNARLEAKDPTGARAAFDQAIKLDPHYSRPWVNLGTLTWSEDGPAAARPILERACREGPQNPAAHGNLGAVLLSLGKPIEAEGHYLQAIELAPGRGALWRGLARALLDQGRRTEALQALDKGIQQMGQDPASERLRLKIQEDELSPP